MNRIRIALAALTFAALGLAQASEITNFPLEKSVAARADVQATARDAHTGPGELYDGHRVMAKTAATTSMKTREAVRMEARASLTRDDAHSRQDLVGGM